MDSPPPIHRVALNHGGQIGVHEFGVSQPARSPVLFLPAMGVPVSYYRHFLEGWAGEGRHVFAMETRSEHRRGRTSGPRSAYGYGALVRHDVPAAFAAASRDRPAILVGHSMGGQLALLASAGGFVDPAGVVTIASGTSSLRHSASPLARARRVAEVTTVRAVSALLGYWPGHRLGFGGRQSRMVMRDWATEARSGRYRLHGDETDYESLLNTIRAPLLLAAIEGDPLIPVASVDVLARRLPVHASRMLIRAGEHDHFRWARRDPHLVIRPIEEWLGASPESDRISRGGRS